MGFYKTEYHWINVTNGSNEMPGSKTFIPPYLKSTCGEGDNWLNVSAVLELKHT